ncbi:hypothetical protein QWY87_03390 [Lutimonas halocynthiae]|uniref:hypothetical protein n=1 Tax=Lutimonas halocynthiae TaxID=1446477 RepID=UPI0025B59CCC|nr:hypothetical protein [Lutimonas halocynthiae]MDN3641727.1 hypothetical protein [Lutimonas halocynthiae]
MNKFISNLILVLLFSTSLTAQVGIGTTSPDASSALEVASTDKGFLMPRMTTVQREAIATPANGLMVFDTDTNSQWTYIGGAWGETKAGVGKFIDGAAADIAYYEGRVGIGRSSFVDYHKLYVENKRDEDGQFSTGVFEGIFEGTGNSAFSYGVVSTVNNTNTGTSAYGIGSQGIIRNSNAGASFTTAVGMYPQIYNDGTINYGSGMISEVYSNAGTMNTARGMDVGVVNASGATLGTTSLASMFATNNGSVTTDAYGLFIGGTGTGTVGGNAYGLYLSTPYANVSGISYGLYADNPGVSYIEGNLGVGTNDPQQKVHVSGVLRLEPQATPPTNGGAGDLYAGTDNKLYFHDGTSWKEIQLVP